VPPEIASKFLSGFPANFKELISEAEAIQALQAADLEDAAAAAGAGGVGQTAQESGNPAAAKDKNSAKDAKKDGVGGDAVQKTKNNGKGKKELVVQEKKCVGKGTAGVAKAAVEWKILNQMDVTDVSSFST